MMEGFLGFEPFDFGIFWVGKFGKYFFVWLDLSRDIFIFLLFFWGGGGGGRGYSKQSGDSW